MKKRHGISTVLKTIFPALKFYIIILSVIACSEQTKQTIAEKKENNLSPPRITVLSRLSETDKPRIIMMDTVPQPSIQHLTNKDRTVTSTVAFKPARNKINNSDSVFLPVIENAKGRGFFSTLTTDDGLALDQVYCSFKDKWGNLWFGTSGGGVSKYDGKNFTNYTTAHGLANNSVWCITQDNNDNLWFGTDGSGVSKFDGQSFTNYTTAQGLPHNVVFSIKKDNNNNLWFGTLKGLSKWDGKVFTNYSVENGLAGNAVKTILQDRKGNLWFGTLDGGISKWDRKHFTNYTSKEGVIGNRVVSLAEDDSANIWIGVEGKGVSKFNGRSFTNYQLFAEDNADAVLWIEKDTQGNLWLATQKTGIIRYDGQHFIKYSTVNGLANNHIRCITTDEKNNLWLASFGSGMFRFGGNSFTNFTVEQGLAGNNVFSIAEDKTGILWIGTSNNGVCRYDGKQFENFTKADGLPRNEIYGVFQDHSGQLWFGTSGGGVSKFNGKSFTNYTTLQGLAHNIVFGITEDKKGNLWFATSGGGVSRFDGKSFINYTTKQGLAHNVVFSIKEDKDGNIWFATLGGGISKFDGASFTNYTVEQGLLDNVVWAITEDKQGNLWFGTQHGLSLLPVDKASQKTILGKQSQFTSFTAEDGLPNNFITQVIQGSGDELYVGTNLGICELLPVKKETSAKGWNIGRIFNTQHGYPVKDVNAGLNAMFKDSKGIIWIGTGSDKTGLVRFEPAALTNSKISSPKVYINQIKINNEAVNWRDIDASRNTKNDSVVNQAALVEEINTYGKALNEAERDSLRKKFAGIKFRGVDKWQALPQQPVFPHYFNNVSFNCGTVETGQSFLVNYQYFLDGYDKDWSPPTRNTYVNFGNISEGKYIFNVKAQSPEGTWGEPTSYSFQVLPPWWRTWWMYITYGIVIIASIFLFVWWKHMRILRQKRILEHKVEVATKQVREETEKVQLQKKKIEDTLNELKETQAQLIQSEKMASLGELTAGIAHEIQNPLNFVNNFSEVSSELIDEMKEEISKSNLGEIEAIASGIKQNLEKINHHGKRADAIIKGMLQHSRQSIGKKEPTDVNVLCDEYLRLAFHGLRAKDKSFNTDFRTDFDETIGKINIVPQDMGRVILNLINNAFYAVNEKKKRLDKDYKPKVLVQTKKVNDTVEIKVVDNGIGIPQNVIDKIFQPFFTTKPSGEGTGLGLSLSYDIITKAHGGEMQVETKEGQFTEFKIILPARSK